MADEKDVIDYYNTRESKQGYMLFLNGTKHFGYYNSNDKPWQFNKALRQMETELAKNLDLPAGSKVLDAGCGMGDVASFLASKHGLEVTGIDILDFNIDEAQKRIKKRGLQSLVHIHLMSYANIDIEDEYFDAVYTMETFVHANNPAQVLREFYRVLKPGGKLVMFEYSHDPFESMSATAVRDFTEMNKLAAMPAFQKFTHGVLENNLRKAGFKDIETQNITPHMLPMVKVFAYIARIPVALLTLLGKRHKLVNGMSGVILWKHRKHFRYSIYTATKPS